MAWYHRLFNVTRPERLSQDLDTEMEFHLQERADELRAQGLPAAQAMIEARRRFGNRTTQKERAHDADAHVGLEAFVADVRYALRALRMSPGFTFVTIFSLALGIGANTAIFSLTNALTLRALPVRHPEELNALKIAGAIDAFTNPLWEALRDHPAVFSASLAYSSTSFELTDGGVVRRATGSWVSGSFFNALGVGMIAGRPLQVADDVRGCPAVAVLSAGFAGREFGGEQAVGKNVSLDGHPFQVIGVVDPAFRGMAVGQSNDVYAPICAEAITTGQPDIVDARSRWYLNIMVRPRAGLSTTQLSTAVSALAPAAFASTVPQRWAPNMQADYRKTTLSSEPAAGGVSDLRNSYRRALVTLMVVVGMVLLIACANIANLLLARAATRQREIAIRLAIGAGRWRLIRQFLTESALLSLGGAAIGVLFARWASQLIITFLSFRGQPISLEMPLDVRVLGFTIAVAGGTALLFGLLPAWRAAQVDPQLAMKSGGRGVVGAAGKSRVAKGLVVGQVALSLALVAAAGLLLGSFRKLVTLDPGFRRDGVLMVEMNFDHTGMKGRALTTAEIDILNRIRALPGVTTASASLITPIGHMGWNDFVLVPGFSPPRMQDSLAYFNQVSENYFATLGTGLVAGRDIGPDDIVGQRRVALVNETLAKRVFGTASPLGRTFRVPGSGDSVSAPVEIIGVVRDAKNRAMDEVQEAVAYYPLGVGGDLPAVMNFEMRTTAAPATVTAAITALAAQTSPGISLEFTTLSRQVLESLARPRILAALSGFFGALALLLAVIGLYGTMSYSVAQRRNEIGIRMALGAEGVTVLRMVVGEAARLVGLGVAVGLVIALVAARLMTSLLYGLTATDPRTLGLAAATLMLIAMAAACVPAWRAGRVSPMTALRQE